MNAHLLTFWATKKHVECTCPWKRKAHNSTEARAKFAAHLKKAQPFDVPPPPRRRHVPNFMLTTVGERS